MNNNRNQSLHQIKLAMRAHTTKPVAANNQYRATAHTQTNYSDCSAETIDRSVQANNETRSSKLNFFLEKIQSKTKPFISFRHGL